MALVCINGARECCGCLQCQEEPEPIYCSECGDELEYDDRYIVDDEYLCEYCLKQMFKAEW